MEKNMHIVIIAPHGDDEIIGCSSFIAPIEDEVDGNDECDYSLEVWYLEDPKNSNPLKWEYEIIDLENLHNILETTIKEFLIRKDKSLLIAAPNFVKERHPVHKAVGGLVYYFRMSYAEYMNNKFNIGLYSTQMNTDFVRLLSNFEVKRRMLNYYYASKRDLWEYEHKYFLYEGLLII